MRIDNSNTAEIKKVKTNIDVKEPSAGLTPDQVKGRTDAVSSQPYSVKTTTVEKALFSLDSELERVMQEAGNIDVGQIKNQLAILSNTLSPEDYEKIQQKGFSLNDTQVDTIVTVMDKIKAELAKGGMDISIFGEDLSMEQMEAITGSTAQAQQMADSLKPCKEEDIKYLLDNELTPTIENLYVAQHSGSTVNETGNNKWIEDEKIVSQIKQVVQTAGLPVNETTVGYGKFMLKNEIPLTPENLEYMDSLTKAQLPLDEEAVREAMSQAVSEGNGPEDAILLEGYSLKDRAEDAMAVVEKASIRQIAYVADQGLPLTIATLKQAQKQEGSTVLADTSTPGSYVIPELVEGNKEDQMKYLSSRRLLEETRLVMTVQANYSLLKQGFAIETQDLENLVAELKDLENSYYRSLLEQNGIEATPENTSLLQETTQKTEALKTLPAYALAYQPLEIASVDSLYDASIRVKTAVEAAGTSYETMMTTPRADLGDSIEKAFGNIGNILDDLEIENTQANQRAVRILAYNNIEITSTTIDAIKAADQKVQLLFQNMTPAVTMEIIREGMNPLEMDVTSLNAKAEEIKAQIDDGKTEKYSKYLWKLEQKEDITKSERDNYIRVYRLFSQIEKSDGAVIGAVVNQGGELSLKNLMTAVKSTKARGIDKRADDTISVKQPETAADTTQQKPVEAVYQTDCAKEVFGRLTQEAVEQTMAKDNWQELTPEQLLWQLKNEPAQEENQKEYRESQLKELSSGQKAEASVLRLLSQSDMPVTTYNILAAGQIINNRNQVFRKLFAPENLEKNPDLEEVKEGILAEFAEALKTPEDMAKAQEALADTAENVMETMMASEDVTSLNIRDLKILRQEIALGTKMTKEENYAIPVMVADEMTNVQLKIVRGKRDTGRIDIMFQTDRLGKVAARVKAEAGRISGYIVSDSKAVQENLQKNDAEVVKALGASTKSDVSMNYLWSDNLDLDEFSETGMGSPEPDKESTDYAIQTKQLYQIAKTCLEVMKRTIG